MFLVTSKCFCKNPVSFVSIILDRFTIVYCWSGDGASSCVHRPTLGQRSKPVSCLAPLLEIVPFVWLHVKTIITKNIPPYIISTPWATLRTCVLLSIPYTSNWSNWISLKPRMISERCMYIYQIGIFSPESHQHKSNCENLNSNRKGGKQMSLSRSKITKFLGWKGNVPSQ